MKNRWIALLLALVLTFSMLPTAFALDADEPAGAISAGAADAETLAEGETEEEAAEPEQPEAEEPAEEPEKDEEMTEEAIQAAMEAQRKEAYNPYARDMMKRYLEKQMGDAGEIQSEELPLNRKEDILANISAITYAKENGFGVEVQDGFYEANNMRLRRFKITKEDA